MLAPLRIRGASCITKSHCRASPRSSMGFCGAKAAGWTILPTAAGRRSTASRCGRCHAGAAAGQSPRTSGRSPKNRRGGSTGRSLHREARLRPHRGPSGCASLVVDCAVHHSPARAARWLQKACRGEGRRALRSGDAGGGERRSGEVAAASGCWRRGRTVFRRHHHGRSVTQAVFAKGWMHHRLAKWLKDLSLELQD